jgi:hypothetical protein
LIRELYLFLIMCYVLDPLNTLEIIAHLAPYFNILLNKKMSYYKLHF